MQQIHIKGNFTRAGWRTRISLGKKKKKIKETRKGTFVNKIFNKKLNINMTSKKMWKCLSGKARTKILTGKPQSKVQNIISSGSFLNEIEKWEFLDVETRTFLQYIIKNRIIEFPVITPQPVATQQDDIITP